MGARLALDPHTLAVVLPMVLAGPLAYWAAYYGLVMDAGRARVRALAGQTLNGRSSAISDSRGAAASRSE